MNKDREIIVTGANGFVGQHLVKILLQNGYNVTVVCRNIRKLTQFPWFNEIKYIEMDLGYPDQKTDFSNYVGAIHLAWDNLRDFNATQHYEANLPNSYKFLKTLIEAGVSRILVTGTCLEYGKQSGEILSSTVCVPNTAYGFAKHALHQQLQFLQLQIEFKLQWTRLFYIYGEGQHPNTILAQLDKAIDNGSSVFNMSGGEQIRDYMHVTEVAERVFTTFQSNIDGTYNICSGKPISIKTLVENHISNRGSKIQLNLGYYPYRDDEPFSFWGGK